MQYKPDSSSIHIKQALGLLRLQNASESSEGTGHPRADQPAKKSTIHASTSGFSLAPGGYQHHKEEIRFYTRLRACQSRHRCPR